MLKEKNFLNIAESVCEKARRLGAFQAESYLSNSKELSIEVRDGQVETMKLAQDRGLGLRVILGDKTGFAFTSDLSKKALEDVAEQAIANARETASDSYRKFPPPSPVYPELELHDPVILEKTVEEKIKMAVTMEEAARQHDPRIKIIESSSYQDVQASVTLVNSLGLKSTYKAACCGLSLSLVAEEGGDQQTGFALDFRLRYNELDPLEVARQAVNRAVRILGASPVTSRRVAVLFDPYVATGFLGMLAQALSAESVQKGRSLFVGKKGQQIASDKVNIIDDGTLPDGIASAPFDGEGVSMSRKTLVKNGVLQGFLYNTYTAAKDKVASTGNGIRPSYKSTPEVGTTNFFIQPGDDLPEDLIRSTTRGFYVTEVIGMHTANPISGDFSVGAIGILIENGELVTPVRGIVIAGNILDLLRQIDGVGNDLKFLGSRGSPTIRIAQMSISGH